MFWRASDNRTSKACDAIEIQISTDMLNETTCVGLSDKCVMNKQWTDILNDHK